MFKFELNKEKSDKNFQIYECEIEDARLTIIKWTTCSVFVKREVYDESHTYLWYMELGNHTPATFTDAKRLAEKMYDIVLWYKPLSLWNEQ